MARHKRNSRTLDKAEIRLASIKSISPTLDVGEGLTVKYYTEKIENLRQSLEIYNTTLSTIDVLLTQIIENEKDLADYSEKILRGVAYKFGNNSHEYQMAGGIRKSERKRTLRQGVALPTS
ncbi:conserved hypothetical protein [Trichormus variabilis ATCC 29413]|uniref:Uncharacterized protein n=2 Tax=Anabaena variabilis TaxID=264691 RepID=Q3MDG4_TRIV2|nr:MULTISPECIES: hypothetical protein [Nostocaceae]ABA20972.1 conserved hypothetical protein [Trichormus variabilis ATCC 29413]MBC1215913.1 hypothetical protein [Trichormus variabilis ARAD]MBC1265644.1 hypothetical protein [Trichormus variabilis FSR]MBC1301685.1 hypothetical protein [Trichormus variabilis N2B]MBC1309944.1 hypothetical protein [Trichormus variabilis PNB]